jgi:hypothetical protein
LTFWQAILWEEKKDEKCENNETKEFNSIGLSVHASCVFVD